MRTALAVADPPAIHFRDRHQAGEGAGDESFLGAVHIRETEVFLESRDRPAPGTDAITLPRVMPPRQYLPEEVHTSPLRTMKKCVELQVATKPCGSSISASS